MDDPEVCPECGSDDTVETGAYPTGQRTTCNDCGASWSIEEEAQVDVTPGE
jgi:transposase-like protein